MRILFRYVLKEFLIPLFYCVMGFASIYVLFELFGSFGRLSEAHPSWPNIWRYFTGYLAPYFEWLAPACLMLAALYTMWSFCRKSELVAMRASGIGFLTIVRPMLLVACVMAGFVYWVNESYVPAHAQWAKQFRAARFRLGEMSGADNLVYRNAETGHTWNVGAVVSDTATALEDVSVSINRPGSGGKRVLTIHAVRADFLDGQWWFERPDVTYFDASGTEIPSPAPDLAKLRLRCFPELTETPEDFLMQNRDWAYCSFGERRQYIEKHSKPTAGGRPQMTKIDQSGREYDMWNRIFAPLACLIITLFAIPAGVATGRQSVFKGIVSALLMFFIFYAATIACMVLAKKALMPPLVAAVLPDILFLGIGIRLFYRTR